MKYKVGDKVKIKTWKELEKEFGLNPVGNINCKLPSFINTIEKELNALNTNRILTIRKIDEDYYNTYLMEEISCHWSEDMIECLVEEYKPEPIYTRFEILDL